jgi:hypothetical protein
MKGEEPRPIQCPLCAWLGHPRSLRRSHLGTISERVARKHSLGRHLVAEHPELGSRARSLLLDQAVAGA